MPTLNTPDAIAAALTAACDALFAMIERDPALLPIGERLIRVLLDEAQAQNLCGTLIVRRLSARLEDYRRRFGDPAPTPAPRGPRHG